MNDAIKFSPLISADFRNLTEHLICRLMQADMSKPKYDYYQTETHVVLTIMKCGLSADSCKVGYANELLTAYVNEEILLSIKLSHPIDSKTIEVNFYPKKIEIRMAKLESIFWESLEQKEVHQSSNLSTAAWDKFAKEIDKDEENGDDVNLLFQKIYANADDNTKRAMIKSITESNGTVLSTNWDEIGRKRVTVQPPDGMEFKKW